MKERNFYNYLKKTGRKAHVIERYQGFLGDFEKFLIDKKGIQSAQNAKAEDLKEFAEFYETQKKRSARTALYALLHYYKSIPNEKMALKAQELRKPRKARKSPFSLKQMLGIDPKFIEKLAKVGIKTANQMIEAGKIKFRRLSLAKKVNIPYDIILELVKLSDLSRVGYVRTKFTRLFYNAGIDTPAELSKWDVKELRSYLNDYIEKSGWEGIAPYPSDLSHYIEDAKGLPQIVEYD
jgi:predicted flap endonuclease-1-like 5' DNA nuclease